MTNKAPAPATPHRDIVILYVEWNNDQCHKYKNVTNFMDRGEYIEFICADSEYIKFMFSDSKIKHVNIRIYKKEIRLLIFL